MTKSNLIFTMPHDRHFSHSQMEMWLTSRSQYWEKYVDGKDMFVTQQMEFGKRVARTLDGAQGLILDTTMATTLGNIEVLSAGTEVMMNPDLEEGLRIKMYMDTCETDFSRFGEYKTSINPDEYDQDKVDELKQMWFYATMIWKEHGIIPSGFLHWVETEYTDDLERFPEGMRLTGHQERWEWKKPTEAQIKDFLQLIKETAWEISESYKSHQQATGAIEYDPTDSTLVDYELLSELRKAAHRANVYTESARKYKALVKELMESQGLKVIPFPGGRVHLTEKGNVTIKIL